MPFSTLHQCNSTIVFRAHNSQKDKHNNNILITKVSIALVLVHSLGRCGRAHLYMRAALKEKNDLGLTNS